jgi:hypothetical protein
MKQEEEILLMIYTLMTLIHQYNSPTGDLHLFFSSKIGLSQTDETISNNFILGWERNIASHSAGNSTNLKNGPTVRRGDLSQRCIYLKNF